MKKTKRLRASALLVSVGMLAVLSAMAFTFVTVMRVEVGTSTVTEIITQTGMLDQWALQKVVEKLLRTPLEGAMYTPVDWAGEEWYCEPLIADASGEISPYLPLGSTMSFLATMPGKGEFIIDARLIDCQSQVNLGDIDWSQSIDPNARARKIRLLTGLPFGLRYTWVKGEDVKTWPKLQSVKYLTKDLAEEFIRIVTETAKASNSQVPTEEALLEYLLKSNKFKKEFLTEEKLTEHFTGKKDETGNVITVGFKDFITFNGWIDDNCFDINGSKYKSQPRSPINVNTASSWVLCNVLFGLKASTPDGGIIAAFEDPAEVQQLVDYIVAYRTPDIFLTDALIKKQRDLVEWAGTYADQDAPASYVGDPRDEAELADAVKSLSRLLVNPEYKKLQPQTEALNLKNVDWSRLGAIKESYRRLPRPFASWAQFDAFLKLLVNKGKLGNGFEDGRNKARLIMANCNPNLNYSGQPIKGKAGLWNLGKDQLVATGATTEFCFSSFGRFEVEMIVSKTRTLYGGLGVETTATLVDGGSAIRTEYAGGGRYNVPITGLVQAAGACIQHDGNPSMPVVTDADRKRTDPVQCRFDRFRFPGDVDVPVDKLQTMVTSAYAPDRICLYNKYRELIAMRYVYDIARDPAKGKTGQRPPVTPALLVLDRPLRPLRLQKFNPDSNQLRDDVDFALKDSERLVALTDRQNCPDNAITYLSVQRLESVKKWNAIVKFADVVRIDTEEDFMGKQGIGDPDVLYFPEPRQKTGNRERDGSICMLLQSPEPGDEYFREEFKDGGSEGQCIRGSVYDGGQLFCSGFSTKKGRLTYEFYTVFPQEKAKQATKFTIGMWVALNSSPREASGDIINTDAKGDFATKISLDVKDSKLELSLSGALADATPQSFDISGAEGISISDWKAGEWHWVGFTFAEDDADQTKAAIFATKYKDDGTVELDYKDKTLAGADKMKLYLNASGQAAFGGTGLDAIIDDILLWKEHWKSNQVEEKVPKTRFVNTKGSKYRLVDGVELDPDKKYQFEQEVEFGTVSWTEIGTSRRLNGEKGDTADRSDVHVKLMAKTKEICSHAGEIPKDIQGDVEFAVLQLPVWFCHDDLLLGWDKIARVGYCGEGQRIAEGVSSIRFWSGYTDDRDEVKRNATGDTQDVVFPTADLFGPLGPDNSGEDKGSFESPYIDDITVSYFPPMEVFYWKEATEMNE